MRRPQRLIAAAVLVALSGALAGCGGGGLGNFDPSDLLDFLDTVSGASIVHDGSDAGNLARSHRLVEPHYEW